MEEQVKHGEIYIRGNDVAYEVIAVTRDGNKAKVKDVNSGMEFLMSTVRLLNHFERMK